MKKRITVWYTEGTTKRDFILVANLSEALKFCKWTSAANWFPEFPYSEFSIDVTYQDKNNELMEEKSKFYQFKGNKLIQI